MKRFDYLTEDKDFSLIDTNEELFLKEMGNLEWELCSVVIITYEGQHGDVSFKRYYFKKQK